MIKMILKIFTIIFNKKFKNKIQINNNLEKLLENYKIIFNNNTKPK